MTDPEYNPKYSIEGLKATAQSERERLSLELAYQLGKTAGITEAADRLRNLVKKIRTPEDSRPAYQIREEEQP